MQIVAHTGDPLAASVELLVFGVIGEQWRDAPGLVELDTALDGAIKQAIKDEQFEGKAKQQLVLNTLGKAKAKRVALIGLNNAGDGWAAAVGRFAGMASRLGRQVGAKQLLAVLPQLPDAAPELDIGELFARGAHLGLYRFTDYLSEKGRKTALNKIQLHHPGLSGAKAKRALQRGKIVAEGVSLARDLVNTAPIDLYPAAFAKRAQNMARQYELKIKVMDPAELRRRKMGLLLGVGSGSSRTPRLVHVSYTPTSKRAAKAPIVLCGKGITFDSGGLNLKPGSAMAGMKMDMGGAAAVMGAMQAVAQLKPNVPVHGIMALAENMPSGSAIRPDDVLTSASGKTVEITNTDAEGRLALGDALHYAQSLKPARIIDLATLTGACIVALGPETVGLFSNEDAFAEDIAQAAHLSGESFWRLPLTRGLREQLKSDVADIKNAGAREGGAITAGLFLQEFVGEHTWAHLDIAGPAMTSQDCGNITKGGTGVAVATLVNLIASA